MPTYCPVEYLGESGGLHYYNCRVCEDCSFELASSTRDDHGLGGCPECFDPGPCDEIRADLKVEVSKGAHSCGIGSNGPLTEYATPDQKFKACCGHIKITEYYVHYEHDKMPRKAKLFAGRADAGGHRNFAIGQELRPAADIEKLSNYLGADKTRSLSEGKYGYCHLIEVAVAANRKIKFHVHLKTA
jgi:hypothetical protein